MNSTTSASPNENLDFLRSLEGKFKGKVTFQDTELSAYSKEDLNESIMENSLIYDSHFLKEEFHGKERNGQKALLGTGFIGFNDKAAEFEGFWIDNRSQKMNFDNGHKEGNSLIMEWESEEPNMGKLKHSRSTTVVDNNHHTIDFFQENTKAGRVKTLSMEFERQLSH